MRRMIAVFALALATQPQPGRVTGVVTDTGGGLIPGTTITLRSAQSERTTVTDTKGAFVFDNVPPGRYAAIASLVGFYGEPHTDVIVSSGGHVSLKFELVTDCLSSVDYIDRGIASAVKEADVIAHIRIPAPARPLACAVVPHCTCTLHGASVMLVLQGQPPRDLRLLQEGAGYASAERPYAPGDEFIAFLKRDDKNHAFGRVAGPTYMFRVRNGRVEFTGRVPAGFNTGMTVAEFDRALRLMR